MIDKKQTAAGQNGKATPIQETPVKKLEVVKIPTAEELQKQVQELTRKLNAIPAKLEDRIEYFNNKKELIRRLSKLEVKRNDLNMHREALADLAIADEFETTDYYLNIEGKGEYSRKLSIFELNDPVLIGEMLEFILGRMDVKISKLQKEIEA